MAKRPPPPTPRSRLRTALRVLAVVAFVFLLAIGGSMFYSWRLASQPPEWWHPVDPANPEVDRTARSVENAISDQMHRVRPTPPASAGTTPDPAAPGAGTWTLVLKEAEANAWLAARLEEWLLNRHERVVWPAAAGRPQVSFADGLVRLGFEVSAKPGEKGRVITVSLAPTIDQAGAMWLRLDSLALGRFPLPGSTVAEAGGQLIESRLPPEMKDNPDTAKFLGALSGKSPLMDRAVMKLSDGRRVEIVRITPRPGVLEIECRTLGR